MFISQACRNSHRPLFYAPVSCPDLFTKANTLGRRAITSQSFSSGGDIHERNATFMLLDSKFLIHHLIHPDGTSMKETEPGDSEAIKNIHSLGKKYLYGMGVKRDQVKGFNFIKIAADLKYPRAITDIAMSYLLGLNGLPEDSVLAALHMKEAADLKCPTALLTLGLMHQHGKGIRLNLYKAQEYFQQALECGNSNAKGALHKLGKDLLALGLKYQYGENFCAQNHYKAERCFRKALECGNADAQAALDKLALITPPQRINE